MEPLNYCTHAIEDYVSVAEGMARKGWPVSAQAVMAAAQLMRRAVKFNLPFNGEVLDVNTLDQSYIDLFVLPYPVVALEFPTGDPDGKPAVALGRNIDPASRCIVLLFDSTLGLNYHPCIAREANRGITIWPHYYNDRSKEWAPSYATLTLDLDKIVVTVAPPVQEMDDYARAVKELQEKLGRFEKHGYAIDQTQASPALPELCDLAEERMGVLESQAIFRDGLSQAMVSAVAFLLYVNAANTGTKVLMPPEKLNKKRLERRKPLFYEAHILELRRHDEDEEVDAHGPIGSREGPRQHFRRSHMRRLKSGKAVIVKEHIVGNPNRGYIDKTYRIPKRLR